MLKFHSALAAYGDQPDADGAGGQRALRLGEIVGTPLMQLGIYPGGAQRLAAAVLPILGEALPDSSLRASVAGHQLIMRTAPDQYWVVGGESGLYERLRNAIPADAGCVTSLDGARTRLLIEGPAARALLQRLLAIDLHPTLFPINGFAQTGIHHVGGLLLKVSEDRYEFFALRTYAASIWEVLRDAAHPLGYQTVLPENMT